MKLIDKAAVVAEIERRIKIHHDYGHYNAEQEFTKVLSFLDTLEVKEVDVENLQEELVSEIILEGTNFNKSWYAHPELAFKAGAKWQKEQMMAKGVDGVVTLDYYGEDDKEYGCVAHDSFCLEDFGLKDMDKVKIILIKED